MKTRMVVAVVLSLFTLHESRAGDPPRLLPWNIMSNARPLAGSPRRDATTNTPASSPADDVKSKDRTLEPLTVGEKPVKSANTEEAARRVGVSVDDLRRLRSLGYLDSEVETLVKKNNRNPRELILEREVLNDLSKSIDAINAKVWQLKLPVKQTEEERERELKAALAKVARDHRAGREEMRKILTGTSYFTPDELRRYLGSPGFFSAEGLGGLRRVGLFNGQ